MLDMLTLDVLWYLVVIVAMLFYTVLDGFDLGVGALHLFTAKDEDRRIFLNAIGPVWDGNEVWLVIVGGALFAGFPGVYATIFSGFYNLVMLLLAGLIFRACAIEFRSKHASALWRKTWDRVFCVASIAIAFGVGLMLGNLVQGIPLNENHDFVGTFRDHFTPYSLLVGAMSVSLFTMHGAIYLVLKTEGKLHNRLRLWVNRSILAFMGMYVVVTLATLHYTPYMMQPMRDHPWFLLVPALAILSILNIPRQMYKKNDGWAFLSSCLSILLLLSLFGIGTFPTLVRSTLRPETNSLSIENAASSPLTLKVLLIIVVIGVPLVLAYGTYVYRLFRGKVKLEKTSY